MTADAFYSYFNYVNIHASKIVIVSFQAMSLVTDVRTRLINWRNDGWEPLLEDVKAFCTKNDIPIPNMDDIFTKWGKSRKGGQNNVTSDHFFRVDTFYAAIDSITIEFYHRFNGVLPPSFKECTSNFVGGSNYFKV